MASVNDYLKKLLYQYDCVVVPELGAFLTHYQSATFTDANGVYLPPRKRVAFNEALRFDDGILANYIMLHEPVTREGAQRHVSQFVGELRQQVAETGRFEVDGIGTFTRNGEGRFQFDPSLRHNFFGEAYGMNALTAQLIAGNPVEAVVVEASPTALGPVLPQEDAKVIPLPRSQSAYWRAAVVAVLVGSLGLVSYLSVVKPEQPLQSSLDPAGLLRLPESLLNRPAEKRVVAAPIVLRKVNPATTAAPKPVAVANVTVPKPTLPAPATAPVVATTPVVRPRPEPTPVPAVATPKPARTEPHFTVIAGSFSSKRNALRLKRQLRRAGYTDAFIIMPTVKGQLYKVAAAGSADRSEAVANVAAISELAGTTAWIYKK